MTTATRYPTPHPDLSVTEAAKLIGVSRARVYQRITGYAGHGDAGAPLSVTVQDGPTRKKYRVPIAIALTWRAERQANHLPVGPIPEHLVPAVSSALQPITLAPMHDADQPQVISTTVGMPGMAPF